MIEKILKFQGNEKYICILASTQENELLVFYALIEKLNLELHSEETNYDLGLFNHIFSHTKHCEINIPILAAKDSSLVHIIKIDNEKEYEHICLVIESLI